MKYALLLLLLVPQQAPHLLQDIASIDLEGPGQFAFHDLDGDGKRDLVALIDRKAEGAPTDSTLHWYTQGPALGFKAAGKLKLPDAAPHSMVLTKNEGVEVVTGFYESHGAGRYAWQKGGFKGAGRVGSGTCPGIIQCADVNGDKRDDLLFAPAYEGNKTQLVVEVLLSQKGGYTAVKEMVDLGAFPSALGSGDFNKDKKRDLVVGFPGGALQVFLGSGDGRFKKGVRVSVPTRADAPQPDRVKPLSIATADLNGDGVEDVLVGCEGSWNLVTFLSDGKGGLTVAENLAVKGAAARMVTCDWNADGFADVWVHSTGLKAIFQLFLGDGKGVMKPAGSIQQPGFATFIAALDLDGEPGLEFVAGFERMQTMDGFMGKDEMIFYKPGAK